MNKHFLDKQSRECSPTQVRQYQLNEVVAFYKTREAFGGLSNMAGGFPLKVNGVRIPSSEALYQACRYPHLPHVQREIIGQLSPMIAKNKSKPYRTNSRHDWNQVRTRIMRWCLQVKLAQHYDSFSALLIATGDRPIVEYSMKDDFWGAKPISENLLEGKNILGRLLMELRERIKDDDSVDRQVAPLKIPNFQLFGKPIETIQKLNFDSEIQRPLL